MANARPLRATDKDLLVAQKVLGEIRFPNQKELTDIELKKRKQRLEKRFVDQNFGDGKLKTVQAKPKMTLAVFDLRVSFRLKKVPYNNRSFSGEVHFLLRNVPGTGFTKPACLADAKETLRKHLVKGLRTKDSKIQKLFFKNVIVAIQGGKISDKERAAIAEKLRLWIGNSLWRKETLIRKKFEKAVKHEEVVQTHKCTECGIRVMEAGMNIQVRDETKKWVCLGCHPYPEPGEESPDGTDEEEDEDCEECGEHVDDCTCCGVCGNDECTC